jgi:hypothetical protein|tara:strand:- start:1411 stop:2433 length:1023 start_codon:yes stop_codon:yes gene_type:complete
MIKIKLAELDKHRNETTFRPYILIQDQLRDIGIELTHSDDCDFIFVGQASIIDKKVSLEKSIEMGLEFLSTLGNDYFIVDGQDATSLIGTVDVFRESKALFFLKNCYLKDFSLYKNKYANGRIYWGEGNYSVDDIDSLKDKMKLSGVNWLNTVNPNWQDYTPNKPYDVSCMFGYPTEEPVYEHELCQTDYYDPHRKALLDKLENTNYKVAKLVDGKRISQQEYMQNMYNSKIIMAPLGYGEAAVRDIEAAMLGSVLMKPDMSYINTTPDIYVDDETYIAVKYDWSNLIEKIDYVLDNYDSLQGHLVEGMRWKFVEEAKPEKTAQHLYNILSETEGVEVES